MQLAVTVIASAGMPEMLCNAHACSTYVSARMQINSQFFGLHYTLEQIAIRAKHIVQLLLISSVQLTISSRQRAQASLGRISMQNALHDRTLTGNKAGSWCTCCCMLCSASASSDATSHLNSEAPKFAKTWAHRAGSEHMQQNISRLVKNATNNHSAEHQHEWGRPGLAWAADSCSYSWQSIFTKVKAHHIF